MLFDFLDSGFGGHNNSFVLFNFEIDVATKRTNNARKAVIHLCGICQTTGDNQRRTCLVNQNGVDFVDYCKMMTALHLVVFCSGHVVAQIVKTKFVVRSVGDVGCVVDTLFCRRRANPRNDQTNFQTHEAVDTTHPFGMKARKIIVDRDDVHTVAAERVEISGQRGDQRLALTCAHFCNPTRVERGAAH